MHGTLRVNTTKFQHPFTFSNQQNPTRGRYETSFFLQTNTVEEHRDYLRFVWFQEFNLDENIILHCKRIVFGLTCSPTLLNSTVKRHLEKFLSIDSFKNLSKNWY